MIEITVPRLGWSMEEAAFSEWLKRDGDWVEKGDMLFVLESDKAAQEIESFDAGLLRIGPTSPKPGDTVQVGQVIGHLLARGESEVFQEPTTTPPNLRETTLVGEKEKHDANRSPQRSEERFAPNVPGASVLQPVASPRARRVAGERGVDWRSLRGTGRDGRVRERDVLAAASTPTVRKPTEAPLSTTRRTIAERMVASFRSTAPVTLTTRVDAANLVKLRDDFKCIQKVPDTFVVPSVTDIMVKLAAIALEGHPDLNARWHEERVVRLEEINVGFAVDTEAGLLVPVIRNVPKLNLKQIAELSRTLVDKARQRRLTADELRGGTFTVTNLGTYGIDAFTPIINAPEAAILGVGAVRREAIVLDDERLVPGHVLTLSLTFDHRIVDGAPAARFLQTLRKLIENPADCSRICENSGPTSK